MPLSARTADGKTTLFRLLTGVLRPSAGEVRFEAPPSWAWASSSAAATAADETARIRNAAPSGAALLLTCYQSVSVM
ncbi:MAG: hypothetical protein ACREFO_20020 [Acetobacteraceae bacterium]